MSHQQRYRAKPVEECRDVQYYSIQLIDAIDNAGDYDEVYIAFYRVECDGNIEDTVRGSDPHESVDDNAYENRCYNPAAAAAAAAKTIQL